MRPALELLDSHLIVKKKKKDADDSPDKSFSINDEERNFEYI